MTAQQPADDRLIVAGINQAVQLEEARKLIARVHELALNGMVCSSANTFQIAQNRGAALHAIAQLTAPPRATQRVEPEQASIERRYMLLIGAVLVAIAIVALISLLQGGR